MYSINNKLRVTMFLILAIMLVFSTNVFAQNNDNNNDNNGEFYDVSSNHWAYKEIAYMAQEGIITGDGKGYFNPDSPVKRSEFAKIMVLSLDLPLSSTYVSSFKDISKNDWEFKYVETAKVYLTGFKRLDGDYFKPDEKAVREDMAVALVKALGYDNEEADLSVLNKFSDLDQISPNLRGYVALAIEHEIMQGFTVNNGSEWKFGAQENLTKAQAAILLYRSAQVDEEKVTYGDEEEKVVYDKGDRLPQLSVTVSNGEVYLDWETVDSNGFVYYKVVISKYDSTPVYPENGYLYVISNVNDSKATINNNKAYNNGDFGKYLVSGGKYYVSITAVYNDEKVAGNVLTITYP